MDELLLELDEDHLANFADEICTPEKDFDDIDDENYFCDELIDGGPLDELIENQTEDHPEDLHEIQESFSYQPPNEPLVDR
jgi:hypothetical protein